MDRELVDYLDSIKVIQELESRDDYRITSSIVISSGNRLGNPRYYVRKVRYNYWNETDDFLLVYYLKEHYIIELYFYDQYKEIYRFKYVDDTIKLLNKLIL